MQDCKRHRKLFYFKKDYIFLFLNKPWDWGWISGNPNITMEIVEKHPDIDLSNINQLNPKDSIPWHWKGLSCNPNLTMEFIEKYLDIDLSKINQLNPKDSIPWHWEWISISKFEKEKERFMLDKYCQYIKDHLKEELEMVAYHPLNIDKYLSMGYKIGELDEIM